MRQVTYFYHEFCEKGETDEDEEEEGEGENGLYITTTQTLIQ